jgi:hypothetical protein
MAGPEYPCLYQVNTRVWLTDLSRSLGRHATLDDVPDAELDHLAAMELDWIWLLSVWRTGAAGQQVSLTGARWRQEFEETLPDLTDDDIAGSGFAITGYTVHAGLGGDEALAGLRERLRSRGLRLMLDFVPNHTGLDHPWVDDHPEYYIAGNELDLARAPGEYCRVTRAGGDRILGHGRDPYFPGWPDTLQLDYSKHATQEAMLAELTKVASQCDGVRCDMAMLILPDVFQRTWGVWAEPFWPRATRGVRERHPGFCFLAEVYWDLEWTLQQQGFDYTYDKRLYDRLRVGQAGPVRDHLRAGLDYQSRLARFLENHDEPRAAAAFAPGVHEAAAVITYLSPGMRFLHQGQLEGRRKRISPHLCRGPEEPVDQRLSRFYHRLLDVLRRPVVRQGRWRLVESSPAWDGNGTWDGFVAFAWEAEAGQRLLAAVNFAATPSQCWLRVPFSGLEGSRWTLRDLTGDAIYERDGGELSGRGLYLDVGPWQYHVFQVTP